MTELILTADASGAALAGKSGLVVVIVDIIDFSTSMEAAIDAGAAAVYGAGTDNAGPPVKIDPYKAGIRAGREAQRLSTGIYLVAEPRAGDEGARRAGIKGVIEGIESVGKSALGIIPNLGAETPKYAAMKGMVIVGVTATGGVAYDAAVTAGASSVITGTVARTLVKSGFASARASAERAVRESRRTGKGIAIVAASGNSLEDLLAAEYLYKAIIPMIR